MLSEKIAEHTCEQWQDVFYLRSCRGDRGSRLECAQLHTRQRSWDGQPTGLMRGSGVEDHQGELGQMFGCGCPCWHRPRTDRVGKTAQWTLTEVCVLGVVVRSLSV